MARKSKIIKQLNPRKMKYKVRYRNRCHLCGRPRGYLRFFGLCRLCFRELAHKRELPGVSKASW